MTVLTNGGHVEMQYDQRRVFVKSVNGPELFQEQLDVTTLPRMLAPLLVVQNTLPPKVPAWLCRDYGQHDCLHH